jgi:hypothetical protein
MKFFAVVVCFLAVVVVLPNDAPRTGIYPPPTTATHGVSARLGDLLVKTDVPVRFVKQDDLGFPTRETIETGFTEPGNNVLVTVTNTGTFRQEFEVMDLALHCQKVSLAPGASMEFKGKIAIFPDRANLVASL